MLWMVLHLLNPLANGLCWPISFIYFYLYTLHWFLLVFLSLENWNRSTKQSVISLKMKIHIKMQFVLLYSNASDVWCPMYVHKKFIFILWLLCIRIEISARNKSKCFSRENIPYNHQKVFNTIFGFQRKIFYLLSGMYWMKSMSIEHQRMQKTISKEFFIDIDIHYLYTHTLELNITLKFNWNFIANYICNIFLK